MIGKLETNYITRGNLTENINNGRTERRKLSMDSNNLCQNLNAQNKPLKLSSLTNSLEFFGSSLERVDDNTPKRTHKICTGISLSANKSVENKVVSKKTNVDALFGKIDGLSNKQYEQPDLSMR